MKYKLVYFRFADCAFEDVSGFVWRVCTKRWGIYYQCPGSNNNYYRVLYKIINGQTINRLCIEDTYHYTACYLPFAPLIFNNTVVAVCGHVVCDRGYTLGSGELTTSHTWCNNKVQCYNGGVDEKYCREAEVVEEVFECYFEYLSHIVSKCDGKCDCYHYCEDEWQCGGYNYHYWYTCSNTEKSIPSFYVCDANKGCNHGDDASNCEDVTCVWETSSVSTYKLANYSRCTPWVWCAHKLDQTNCTDSTLAPLKCHVGGYTSTVSQYIICKTTVYTYDNEIHSNTSAVCDNGIDVQCVTPVSGCYIHKHQLCNNVTDCKDGSDEKNTLCDRVTAQDCRRSFNYATSLNIPVEWIRDGVADCVDGIDEDITKWKSCKYSTFTIYGIESCEDVYICPSGYPLYIDIKSICDVWLSCQGGTEICNPELLTLSQQRYTPAKVENVNYLHYCLIGLEDLYEHIASCEHVTYPTVEIIGTQPNYLHLPTKQVSCKYMYSEQYVYLSCSGKCYDARCPLTPTPLSSSTCSNILKEKIYSLSFSGSLVLVKKEQSYYFSVNNIFLCDNGNCVHYNKICNLKDDCGDGTDEDSCDNHFVCNVKSNYSKSYIALSSVCDGKDDCLDSSDESSCCHRQLIDDFVLKISSWLIGTLSLLLNGVTQVRSICTLKRVRTSSALTDKVLMILINFGDWLVGGYLFSLAVIDVYFGSTFCLTQFDWLLSSSCSILGVVNTAGSQISLFSMTILSVTRVFRISKGLSISGPVNKKCYVLMVTLTFFILGLSVAIAVIPLLPLFEDTFANGLYYPDVDFLRGFATKSSLKPTLASYYGRIRLRVSSLSWNSLRSLINGMFTSDYEGIYQSTLGFYGNDPVCLFKFFVSSHEPQTAFSWSILTVNFVCFGAISISYLIVFAITSTSSSRLSKGATGTLVRNRNHRLQRKVSVIILTDFLCWVPFIIICLLHTKRIVDASPWYALLSILILPINSVINPLLYDDIIGRTFGRIVTDINMRLRGQGVHIGREPGQMAPQLVPSVTNTTEITQISFVSRSATRHMTHGASHTCSDIDGQPEPKSHPILLDVGETRV